MSPDGARVAFQLDRFEQTGEDRLEITGRWYGVRGLRFVRPALTVQTQDGERNLLAVLEHKPWAAEEGESWIAAFPWQGESPDPDQAELSVAPSVVVALVRDETGKKRGKAKPNLRQQLTESETRARRLDSEVAWLREEREALVADKKAAEEEAAQVRSELRESHAANEAVVEERDAVARERDDAVFQRDTAAGERDRALHGREQIEGARDEAVAERDAALAARAAAIEQLEAAQRQAAEAVTARDAIVGERNEAVEERLRAFAERDAALGRGSGFPAISAADLERQPHAPDPTVRQHRTNPLPAMGEAAGWTARAIAGGALLVLLIVVVVLLKVL